MFEIFLFKFVEIACTATENCFQFLLKSSIVKKHKEIKLNHARKTLEKLCIIDTTRRSEVC